MTPPDPSAYGDVWAESYDDLFSGPFIERAEEAAGLLADLARGGRALELGIGTGRVALPLAARGVEVHGIDASEPMLKQLRAKEGGEAVPVVLGNFADVGVEGDYSLVFVVFNTLFLLQSQNEQVRCFQNVAERLTDDGVFVVEAFVPDVARFQRGQVVQALGVGEHEVRLEAVRHDPVSQQIVSQDITISEGGTRLRPLQLRYAWPAELDLMAQLAGMRLRDRWGAWDRSPFTASSAHHISVYGKS